MKIVFVPILSNRVDPWINLANLFCVVCRLSNNIELKLVNVVDSIVPLATFVNNVVPPCVPPQIKSKVNKRKRLLKLCKKKLFK